MSDYERPPQEPEAKKQIELGKLGTVMTQALTAVAFGGLILIVVAFVIFVVAAILKHV